MGDNTSLFEVICCGVRQRANDRFGSRATKLILSKMSPLSPREATSQRHQWTSPSGQKETLAPQQNCMSISPVVDQAAGEPCQI
jgi:hypothetical protein